MIAIPRITRAATGIVMSCPSVLIQLSESHSEKQTHNRPAAIVSATRSFSGM